MLTPMDIEKKRFSKRFRGYDDVEVDEFLNLILVDYEKLYRENASLRDKNAMLAESLSKYKTMESTMQNTLVAAQATGEEIRKNASEKADNIIKEAELKAKEIMDNAINESRSTILRFIETKHDFEAYKIKAISALKAQLELLESIGAESEGGKESVYTKQSEIKNTKLAADFPEEAASGPDTQYMQGDTAPVPRIEPEITFSKRNLSYDLLKENMLKTDA